ncbi:cyclin [Cristinia sonorae]|uniref:Cyclin n=1 Tax=Cristinia sonorae TaxID=1940300 RepID=A0A8K0UNL3_9AGAR|nr:cyclin [Cristinia sonorae]
MTNNLRLPLRNRTGPQRTRINGDENATRHVRKPSTTTTAAPTTRATHPTVNVNALKNGPQPRSALNEVTITAVNRKKAENKLSGKDKETESGLKRSRSSSLAAATGPQRVPLGPGRSAVVSQPAVQQRLPSGQLQKPAAITIATSKRFSIPHGPAISDIVSAAQDDESDEMDIEEPINHRQVELDEEDALIISQEEVETMVGVEGVAFEDDENEVLEKPVRVWPEVSTARANRFRSELDQVKEIFADELNDDDTTMVSEYANEIFAYMNELEEDCMPNPDYMSGQSEINWQMRQTLVDWLLQVHLRYHMLPETLWIAVNIVDRFLTKRVVSLVKLQLVGVTAMFIAAKYEEIVAPSVEEFVFMTENGYTKEEILKGERIMLQTLDFKVSYYCSPYSWMRKISKADDYEIQTRTLSKFLTEVTLLDYRFLRVKPSMVAAIGMYTARRMLGGDWVSTKFG